MFERRLRMMLWMFAGAGAILILRLGQLQFVEAGYYRQRAADAVQFRATDVPFIRGSIVDRNGEVLVQDEPTWELAVDFKVLAADVGDDPSVARAVSQHFRRRGRYPADDTADDVETAFRQDVAAMWTDLAWVTADHNPRSIQELRDQARNIYDRVMRIRRAVAGHRGFDAPVLEERQSHPIVTDLDESGQIAARERFSSYPWVRVRPSSRRSFGKQCNALAHVLGRLGRVTARHLSGDPNQGDPFAEYRPDELVGISGVEWAAEQTLRGRRGLIVEDRHRDLVKPRCIEPEDGRNVVLTLDAELQRRLYDRLRDVVEAVPESSGGAIVVLDTARRNVLALVSYPSYDPSRFNELYPTLRDDTARFPLRFRAVSNYYPPGSTVKPLVCLAGLIHNAITLETRQECRGYLFPEVTDRWRCWQIHGTNQRKAHGMVDVVQALAESCNVYMYLLGQELGVKRLCTAFDMVGIGRPSGIGLKEEASGINPTPSWLMTSKNIRATAGTARLFAIGQGEIALTPVQVANLMATYATGRYRPVTLIQSNEPTPEWILPGTEKQWKAIREGIFKVVNDPAGTAYEYARLEHGPQSGSYVLCAKTGSATARPWPTAYRVRYIDSDGSEAVESVPAGSKANALVRFRRDHPAVAVDPADAEVAARWPRREPTEGVDFAHAWVGGYLQACNAAGRPDWSNTPPVAFAVLVEFGGSGGRIAGPLARGVAQDLIERFGPTWDFDTPSPFPNTRALDGSRARGEAQRSNVERPKSAVPTFDLRRTSAANSKKGRRDKGTKKGPRVCDDRLPGRPVSSLTVSAERTAGAAP